MEMLVILVVVAMFWTLAAGGLAVDSRPTERTRWL